MCLPDAEQSLPKGRRSASEQTPTVLSARGVTHIVPLAQAAPAHSSAL